MTPYTPQELAAIAAYTGPVTICPPHQHTEGMFYANGSWHREGIPDHLSAPIQNKAKERGKATTRHIESLLNQGMTTAEICKEMGMSHTAVTMHIKRIQDDT